MLPAAVLLSAVLQTAAWAAESAAAGSMAPPPAAEGVDESAASKVLLVRPEPDPGRLARARRWWRRYDHAAPSIEAARRRLAARHRGWSGPDRGRCADAGRRLAAIDTDRLLIDADYLVAVDVGRAVVALRRAAAACRLRRYFEMGYHLGLADRAFGRLAAHRARLLRRPTAR